MKLPHCPICDSAVTLVKKGREIRLPAHKYLLRVIGGKDKRVRCQGSGQIYRIERENVSHKDEQPELF